MEIDDSFYNRQRYVLGDDAMKLLSQSSIYLYGLKGLGIEIAKNLVLGGVKELYLDDIHTCKIEDMGSQFYITEQDVENKLTRAEASIQKISQLNPYVKVCISPVSLDHLKEPMKNEINKEILEKIELFSCIVLSGCDLIQIGIIDNFCRSKGIKLVVADVMGLFGIIFCDFGENFTIKSESDEENVEFFIGFVSNDKHPTLKVLNDDTHGLKDGDIVTFKDVDGMVELNGQECEITVDSKSAIKLKLDSTNWSKYTKNGICVQKKLTKILHFNNFYDQCFKPSIINPDFCKIEHSRCLQLLYLALRHFHNKHKRLPAESIESDYQEIQQHLNQLNTSFEEFNASNWSLIKKLCDTSSGELQPLSAIFGGITAQEAIKAVTQQFTPIQQWFIMECECLAPTKFERHISFTKYDNLKKCVGQDLVEKLHNLRIFMIGCGAIGCELLKNMTMLGISTSSSVKNTENSSSQLNNCGTVQSRIESSGDGVFSSTAEADDEMNTEDTDQSTDIVDSFHIGTSSDNVQTPIQQIKKSNSNLEKDTVKSSLTSDYEIHDPLRRGKIVITDNDLIEKSNLNRQFLFKSNHIKQPKSLVCRQSVLEINPNMSIEAHQNFVGIATENIYSDNFFQQIDVCLNALDNIESRKYMDNRCVINEKYLIESGTMSTKGHVQVIIPHLTENYSNQSDPSDKQIPYCTLKSFPAKVEHCIEWAREKFESNFFLKPSIAVKYLNSIDLKFLSLSRENQFTYEDLIKIFQFFKKQPNSFKECVQVVRLKFEILFNHKACQLLHSFPLDTKLEDGSFFWQLPRRRPNPINFNFHDELHYQFIVSYSKLIASIYGINANEEDIDSTTYQSWIEECVLPPFTPSDKSIEIDESVNRDEKILNEPKTEDVEINEFSLIELLKSKDIERIKYIEFDKDNSLHIQFMSALTNLRSKMYGIEEVDEQTVKKISGRIIPAIATTTSVIAGLVLIELIKIAKKCEFHLHRNAFLNLSLSQFILSEPGNCQYDSIINNRGERITFSLWDHWNVIGDDNFTIQHFITDLERQKSLTVNMILQGNRIIYMNILPGSSNKLNLRLNNLLVITDEDKYVDFLISYSNPKYEPGKDNENEDIKGPRVRYWLNRNLSK